MAAEGPPPRLSPEMDEEEQPAGGGPGVDSDSLMPCSRGQDAGGGGGSPGRWQRGPPATGACVVGRDREYQLSLHPISAVTHTAKGREGKGHLCRSFLKAKQKARLG